MVTCLLKLEVSMLPLFLRVPVSVSRYQYCLSFYECLCQVRESGHLSVKVRGINVASLSTSSCVK